MEQYEVLNVRKYKAGYEIRTIIIPSGESGTNEPSEIKQAFTPEGDYIGGSKRAYHLTKRGIVPEKSGPEDSVCSIGFSESEQKWYGWSHRAIFGFEIGYVVEEGAIVADSGWTEEWLKAHPEDDLSVPIGFQAQTLADCKRLARAYADGVR